MSEYVSVALRNAVRERAGFQCEYCLLPEAESFFPFEPDHIIARKHGGQTELLNLASSCLECNRLKGTDIASVDSDTGRIVRLFHPRQDVWPDHFEMRDGVIVPNDRHWPRDRALVATESPEARVDSTATFGEGTVSQIMFALFVFRLAGATNEPIILGCVRRGFFSKEIVAMNEPLDASRFIDERQSGACLFALRSAGAVVEKGETKYLDQGNVVRIHFSSAQQLLVRNVLRQFE